MTGLRAHLTSPEARLAAAIADRSDDARFAPLGALPSARQALVLEAALLRLRHREGFQPPPERAAAIAADETDILLRRSEQGEAPVTPAIPAESPPQLGHGTAAVGAGFGAARTGTFEELRLRGALHDLLGAPAGFNAEEQIEMLSLRLRFENERRQLVPEVLDLVNIVSLAPLTDWVAKPSWRLRVGLEAPHKLGCDGWSCTAIGARGGPGLAFASRLLGREVYYVGVTAEAYGGPAFPHAFRTGAGALTGMMLSLGQSARLLAEARVQYRYLGEDRGAVEHAFAGGLGIRLARDLELRIEGETLNPFGSATTWARRYDEVLGLIGLYY